MMVIFRSVTGSQNATMAMMATVAGKARSTKDTALRTVSATPPL